MRGRQRFQIAHRMDAIQEAPVARIDEDDVARGKLDDRAVALPHVEKVDAQLPFRPRRQLVGGQQRRERHKEMQKGNDKHENEGAERGQRPLQLLRAPLPAKGLFPFFSFEKAEIASLISSIHRLASS